MHHILPVLPINNLVNQDVEPTKPHTLSTGKKSSVSNLCVIFSPCVVQTATVHVDRKALNMCHQSKKGFWGIIVIPPHQKGYLAYVPSTIKIVSSHYVVFNKTFSTFSSMLVNT